MKEHKLDIIFISILNIVLTILFILCLNKSQNTLQEVTDLTVDIWKKVVMTISFIISVAVLDITTLGVIILCKKGFALVILINVVVIALSIAIYFRFFL